MRIVFFLPAQRYLTFCGLYSVKTVCVTYDCVSFCTAGVCPFHIIGRSLCFYGPDVLMSWLGNKENRIQMYIFLSVIYTVVLCAQQLNFVFLSKSAFKMIYLYS